MNTSVNCTAKKMRQLPGNKIHKLLVIDQLSVSKTVRTINEDIETTEILYTFKDGSQIRMTESSGLFLFIASKGPKL